MSAELFSADVFVRDVWEDIKPLINLSKERTGYPTQKPVALAERIIAASSNPGDLVLDPFTGCAYVPVAVENLAREWVACDLSGWRAWCCGFANWKTDSTGRQIIDQTTRNFELDHIDPQSKRGRHEIDNRAPLCPYHNGVKSDRRVHLDDLREEIAAAGDLAVASIGDLVDLAWARDQALEYWAEHRARQRLDH